jgi:hypothetical protein
LIEMLMRMEIKNSSPGETAAHERRRPRTQTSPRPTAARRHAYIHKLNKPRTQQLPTTPTQPARRAAETAACRICRRRSHHKRPVGLPAAAPSCWRARGPAPIWGSGSDRSRSTRWTCTPRRRNPGGTTARTAAPCGCDRGGASGLPFGRRPLLAAGFVPMPLPNRARHTQAPGTHRHRAHRRRHTGTPRSQHSLRGPVPLLSPRHPQPLVRTRPLQVKPAREEPERGARARTARHVSGATSSSSQQPAASGRRRSQMGCVRRRHQPRA